MSWHTSLCTITHMFMCYVTLIYVPWHINSYAMAHLLMGLALVLWNMDSYAMAHLLMWLALVLWHIDAHLLMWRAFVITRMQWHINLCVIAHSLMRNGTFFPVTRHIFSYVMTHAFYSQNLLLGKMKSDLENHLRQKCQKMLSVFYNSTLHL